MKKTVIISSILALIFCGCGQLLYAQFRIPTRFSEFERSPCNGWRLMKRIYIDFDGDGKKDTATILKKDNNERLKCYFHIYLTSSNKNYTIKMLGTKFDDYDNKYDNELFSDIVCALPLSVKNKVIQFEYFLDGTGAVKRTLKLRYNQTKQKIQLIGYDSGYTIYYGGNCSKSYNLLTGDYVVTNHFYEYVNFKEKRKEVHKGNKKMKEIFLEDITHEIIEQLDLVGSEFEKR